MKNEFIEKHRETFLTKVEQAVQTELGIPNFKMEHVTLKEEDDRTITTINDDAPEETKNALGGMFGGFTFQGILNEQLVNYVDNILTENKLDGEKFHEWAHEKVETPPETLTGIFGFAHEYINEMAA